MKEIFPRNLIQGAWWSHTHTHSTPMDFRVTHRLHLPASPFLHDVTAFLTVLSDTEAQGLILPDKGTALVCCFQESSALGQSPCGKSGSLGLYLSVRKPHLLDEQLFKLFSVLPQTRGFASCKEMKVPKNAPLL